MSAPPPLVSAPLVLDRWAHPGELASPRDRPAAAHVVRPLRSGVGPVI